MKIVRSLDISVESTLVKSVREGLNTRVIKQTAAKDALLKIVQKIESKLYDSAKPVGSVLIIGPTGAGKTRVVEALAECMFGDRTRMIKVDCGEFQHSHEIAKLVGSPPGYLGHRETKPMFTNERIKTVMGDNKDYPVCIVLFDEIEKASDALWHLMLGILDKGELTTGANERVDMTKCVILMTSNAGSQDMSYAFDGGMGFGTPVASDKEIERIGIEAAKRKFTVEFINRLDAIAACTALTKEDASKVLDIEIERLQVEIFLKCIPVQITVSRAAKDEIVREGYSLKYNARNIKRALEKYVQVPMARILTTGQVESGDRVYIDFDKNFTYGLEEKQIYD